MAILQLIITFHKIRPSGRKGSVAEWSKALVLGTSPKGRGFESHSCHGAFWPWLDVPGAAPFLDAWPVAPKGSRESKEPFNLELPFLTVWNLSKGGQQFSGLKVKSDKQLWPSG